MQRARLQIPAVCLILLLGGRASDLWAQTLNVRLDGNELKLAAPQIHLLTGEPLRQLRDGASVNYILQATIAGERNGAVLLQATYRFVMSYDLWEERFAITRLAPSPRSASHLSMAAAEMWLFDSIAITVGSLNPDRPFWVWLEYRVESPVQAAERDRGGGLTLAGLIDIFSRKKQDQELRGKTKEAGPFRLSDLRRSNSPRVPETR